MTARQCEGITAAGNPCRRPPSKDRPYCLAHDEARKDEHAAISSAGGVARHDPAVASTKDELREIKAALWSRTISPGIATALLQTIRLEREHDADEKRENPNDELITSIRIMRESGDTPDMSEPANDTRGGISSWPAYKPDEPYDPDAPLLEDSQEWKDAERWARIRTAPLNDLSPAERRQRLAGGNR